MKYITQISMRGLDWLKGQTSRRAFLSVHP
jgi:hypothetical protein